MSSPRTRCRDESDLVLLELVRLVNESPFTEQTAAHRLVRKRYSVGALRLALARVVRAQLERPSAVAQRAAATIRCALADTERGAVTRGWRAELLTAGRA